MARIQLKTVRSVPNEADTDKTYFPDVALGWFMPLRSMPWLYFILLVTTAPSFYETTLPVPAVSLGRGIFMKGEDAAWEPEDPTLLIAGNAFRRAGSCPLSAEMPGALHSAIIYLPSACLAGGTSAARDGWSLLCPCQHICQHEIHQSGTYFCFHAPHLAC